MRIWTAVLTLSMVLALVHCDNNTTTIQESKTPLPTTITSPITTPATTETIETTVPTTTIPSPGAPTDITITNNTSNGLTLDVELPEECTDCNSVIVKYSPTEGTSIKTINQSCVSSSCVVHVSNLAIGTCYIFTVNTRGSGGNSVNGTNKKGCTLPGPPQHISISSRTSQDLTFDVTLPTNCQDCKSIIVKYSTSGEPSNQECITTQSCDIHGLVPGTCYNFTVFTQGTGGISETGAVTKGCTNPTPPTGLEVTAKTSTTVTLVVTTGDEGHDGYRVICIGGEINISRTFSQNNSTLLVNDLLPGTSFTFNVFTLSNGLESEQSYGTGGSTKPSVPTNVTIKGQTVDSVTITVTMGPGTYDGFIVKYKSKNQSFTNKMSDEGVSGSRDLTVNNGLSPGTTYTFYVATLYNGSESTNSKNIEGSTVPNPPSSVTVSGQNISTITLTVQPPSQGGVDHYIFTDTDGYINMTNTTTGDNTYTITGLTAGHTYTFVVKSVFSTLVSAPYGDVTASTLPNPPSSVTVSGQNISTITLTVQPPSQGDVDHYLFTDTDGNIYVSIPTISDNTCTITGLTAGNTYNFVVKSVYSNLVSTPYDDVTASTLPNPPSNVTVSGQNISTITLTVQPPSQGGVDHYIFTDTDGYINMTNTTTGDNTYTITGLTAGRTYTFVVKSVFSTLVSAPYGDVTASTLPNPPSSVTVSGQNISTITLTVQPPSQGGVDHYIFTDTDGYINVTKTTTGDNTYTITGLTAGRTYTFVVKSVFSTLVSAPYNDVIASTVPNPPSSVTVSGQTNCTITLTVQPQSQGGVDYYLFTDRDGNINVTIPTTGDNTYTITGLTAGRTYTFVVKSVFSTLVSAPYGDVTASTLPGSPSNVSVTSRTSQSLILTLTLPPDCQDCDSVIVQYSRTEGTTTQTCPSQSCRIEGLTPGTCYTFIVYTSGPGGNSTTGTNTTGCTYPSIPSGLKVTAKTSTTVTLTVTPGNGGHDGYRVNYMDGDKNITFSQKNSTLLVNDLSPGTSFTFNVFTLSNGLESEQSYGTGGSTKPIAPTNVEVTHQTTTSVILTVTPCNNGYDGFFVEYNGINQTFDVNVTPGTGDSTPASFAPLDLTLDDGLIPGTFYTFSVFTLYNSSMSDNSENANGSTVPNPPSNVTVSGQNISTITLTVQPPSQGGVDHYIFTDTDGYINVTKTTTGDNTYTITGLTAGRTYTFVVKSVFNSLVSTPYNDVIASTVPNPPSSVTGSGQNISTITLTIQPPSQGGVDHYLITDRDGNINVTIPRTDDNTYTIPGLTAGHTYTFVVKSVYKNLVSTPFKDVTVSTVPNAPKRSGYTTTDTMITFTLTTTGGVDEYLAMAVCTSNDVIDYSVSVKNATVTISGLAPATTCNLTAVTVYAGLNSSEAYFTGLRINESTPGKVGCLVAQNLSSTAISVTWNKPSKPNGDIIQYSVYVTNPAGTCEQHIQLCSGICAKSTESCDVTRNGTFPAVQTGITETISGLLAYTRYTFTVYAYTAVGRGIRLSNASNTSQSEPHQIKDVIKNSTTSTTISISFNESEPSTGPIIRYEVRYVYQEQNCSDGLRTGDVITQYTNCTPSSGRTVCSIDTLYPYWDYNISVKGYTVIGPGNWSDTLPQRTDQDKASAIDAASLRATMITAYSVTLEWSAPCPPNGVISHYVILWNTSSPINTTDDSVSYTVQGLLPYRSYTYQVAAVTGGGIGNYTPVKNLTTLTDVPHPPSGVSVPVKNSTWITVQWMKPDLKTGPTFYTATAIDNITKTNTSSCTTNGFESTACKIENLDEYWPYTIVVIATTEKGSTYSTDNKTVRTQEDAPGQVTGFRVNVESDVTKARTVNVTCNPPTDRDLNGIITNYTLEWGYSGGTQNQNTSRTCSWLQIPVEPQKNYTFTVWASTKPGKGKTNSTIQDIPAGAPLVVAESQQMILLGSASSVSDTEKQFRVDFDVSLVCDTKNGKITNRYVFVSEADVANTVESPFKGSTNDFNTRLKNSYKDWSAVKDADNMSPYIASRSWQPSCRSDQDRKRRRRSTPVKTLAFTVGAGGDCSGDCNGYVQPGKSYKVRVALCTDTGCSESEWSNPIKTEPNLTPSIVGGVIGALLAVVIFLVVMFILRRRSMLCFKKDKEEGFSEITGKSNPGFRGESTEMVIRQKPRNINVSEFGEKFNLLSRDSNMKFSEEVKLLKELSPTHPTRSAEEQAVRIKNRYTNILAYDHSRVKLLPLDEEEGSDYINANYIPGHNSKREYIATQGPLVCTKDDFWRMIWEQNVSVIVMLTQLVERGRRKCDQYWPEEVSEPVFFGDLIVRIDSESTLPDYVIRVISMQLGDIERRVKHLLYLAWPDMGTPTTSNSMLKFVESCRKHKNPALRGPIVVHCSAGVGRTGTYIAVDHLIQRLNAGKQEVDIFNMVLGMRNERPNMVQTEDQYIFIHECIKDFLTSGNDEDEEDEEEEEESDEPIYQNT